MVLGVEGVNPPAWGQRPHSPFFQLIMSTYLTRWFGWIVIVLLVMLTD